jgi:outer membrane cobalamin receptor
VDVEAGRELKLELIVTLPADAESRLAAWSLGERSSGSPVKSMSGEEIRRRNLRSVADALRILAPDMVGQESSQPGGRQTLRPRGAPTVAGPRDVLVVIDGIRVVQSPVDALASLNPSDIVRIDVTRGAAGGWRYGIQGANGVVIITTRTAPAEHPKDTPPEECRFTFSR